MANNDNGNGNHNPRFNTLEEANAKLAALQRERMEIMFVE